MLTHLALLLLAGAQSPRPAAPPTRPQPAPSAQAPGAPAQRGEPAPIPERWEFKVYTDAPRLLLTERRLRLLRRERERQSLRYQQFAQLMEGGAAMPEPGFALALWSAVTNTPEPCVEAAGQPGLDPRQLALVMDWCSARLSPAMREALAARLRQTAAAPPNDFLSARNAIFAALALADVDAALAEATLDKAVSGWWKQRAVAAFQTARDPLPDAAQLYALAEILHVIRDNFRLELRETAPRFFDELPALQMLNTYPAPWPAAENEYRIPAYDGEKDPDLRLAALARAAGFATVAYDTNLQANQFLQGWLLLDRFLMKGAFGCIYEFLWANPYQPGLSYYYMPDVYHARGRLILRSSWDEDATWIRYQDGRMQVFENGTRAVMQARNIRAGGAFITFDRKFTAGTLAREEESREREEYVFVVGLKPGAAYDLEIDGEEMVEVKADSGGIVALKFLRARAVGVRLNPARNSAP